MLKSSNKAEVKSYIMIVAFNFTLAVLFSPEWGFLMLVARFDYEVLLKQW